MKISKIGYARCPSCMSHVKVARDANCPFCGAEVAAASVIGGGTMEKIRSSRAALIAMGLAGGVTFAVACGEGDPKPEPTPEPEPNNITADYGGFDPDLGNNGQVDSGQPDPNNITADYGGFDPTDFGQPTPADMGSGSDSGTGNDSGSDMG